MPTYYKAAEQGATTQINWAEIGKGITDMLSNERNIREQKRAALDEVSRQLGNTLADMPQGEDQNANGVITGFTDAAQKQRLLDDKLFKSGQMDYKTYIARRQNLVDDTKLTFSLAETYQKSYKEKMERYEQLKSQQLEIEAAKEVEGLANFNDSQLYIDPVDCTVKAAKTKKQTINGQEVVVPDKNNIFGVKSLFKNLTIKYDRFDTDAAVKKAADSFGEVQDVIVNAAGIHSNGRITTLLDKTQRRYWEKDPQAMKAISLYESAEKDKIKQIMDNPYNTSSIMTEDMGYTYVKTPEEVAKNPDKFLLKKLDTSTGRLIAVPTDAQKQKVAEFLQTQIRSSIDSKRSAQVTGQLERNEPRAKTEGEMAQKDKEDLARNFGINLGKLIAPKTATEREQARTYFTNRGYGVDVSNQGVRLIKPDKTELFNSFTVDNKLSTKEDMVRSIVGAFKDEKLPEELIVKSAMGAGGDLVNTQFKSSGKPITPTTSPALTAYADHINNNFPGRVWGSSEGIAQKLNQYAASIGGSVEADGDAIIVTAPNGAKSQPIYFGDNAPTDLTAKKENAAAMEAVKKWFVSNPKGKDAVEQATFAENLLQTGAIKPTKKSTTGEAKKKNTHGI